MNKNIDTKTFFLQKGLPIRGDRELDILESGGVLMKGVRGHIMSRRKLQKEPQLLMQKFTPFIEPEVNKPSGFE